MSEKTAVSNDISKTLNICNVICTMLVVAIHFNTKHHINLGDGFGVNYYIQEVITNGLARVAVPFFAIVSGFFFFKQYELTLSKYKESLAKRLVSLGVPYLIGASIILLSEVIYGKYISYDDLDVSTLYSAIFVKPLSVQYWFIRDLIFLSVMSPIIYVLLVRSHGWVAALMMILWFLDIEVMPLWGDRSLITIEVGAFFVLGAFLYSKKELLDNILPNIHLPLLFLISLALLSARLIVDPTMANWYQNQYSLTSLLLQNSFIIIFLCWLIGLSYKLRDVNVLLYLSKFTFFVYLYHLLPLSRVIVKVSDYLIVDEYKFYITFPLGLVASFALAIFLSKYLNKVYSLITGGRG